MKTNCLICGICTDERSSLGYPMHAACLGAANATKEAGPNHRIPLSVRRKARLAEVSGHSPKTARAPIYHASGESWRDRHWSAFHSSEGAR